jgi:hypothetical protein
MKWTATRTWRADTHRRLWHRNFRRRRSAESGGARSTASNWGGAVDQSRAARPLVSPPKYEGGLWPHPRSRRRLHWRFPHGGASRDPWWWQWRLVWNARAKRGKGSRLGSFYNGVTRWRIGRLATRRGKSPGVRLRTRISREDDAADR